MAYQELALPIDIPWKRLAISSDMMDLQHGDRKFPPKWRSSIRRLLPQIRDRRALLPLAMAETLGLAPRSWATKSAGSFAGSAAAAPQRAFAASQGFILACNEPQASGGAAEAVTNHYERRERWRSRCQ